VFKSFNQTQQLVEGKTVYKKKKLLDTAPKGDSEKPTASTFRVKCYAMLGNALRYVGK
jgi:hypothetical protein